MFGLKTPAPLWLWRLFCFVLHRTGPTEADPLAWHAPHARAKALLASLGVAGGVRTLNKVIVVQKESFPCMLFAMCQPHTVEGGRRPCEVFFSLSGIGGS